MQPFVTDNRKGNFVFVRFFCIFTPKKTNFMCYENEFCIDQWVEENGKTRYQEFDGTERKDDTPYLDGGIVGGLLDNADRDMHDAFLQDNADRVQRYIGIAIQKAKEDGEDPIEAAHEAVNYYDEYGLSDTEIEAMIENALNPPPKTWTIGFRLNGEPNIKTHTTTAKDGLSAWESIKCFYESGNDKIAYAYTV